MIEFNLIWILLLIIYVLSFIALMTFSFIFRKKDQPFSFLNCFPFEYFSNRKLDVLLYIFALISFCPLFLVLPRFGEMGDLALFNLFLTCFFGLAGITLVFASKISTLYLKSHFKIVTVLFCLAFLLSALVGLHFFLDFSLFDSTNFNRIFYLIFGILSSLLSLLMLVLLFNPKLKDWYKLDSKNVDGNLVYQRTKFISLVYTEWLSILVIFLSEIFFFLSLLKT